MLVVMAFPLVKNQMKVGCADNFNILLGHTDIVFCQSRFWWSLLVGVDWWDAVGCTQSAAEDGIGKNNLILQYYRGL
jgi:hypothetical protein